jgi:flavin reductase (DIM6/NTAB) family NADH-FMN oxidoreductase RutF
MPELEAQKHLAAALGRIPSGLFIVTCRKGQFETGMLASWVQQCSFEPPQVSMAVKKNRPLLSWLEPGQIFTINILDESQTDMIVHFGRGFGLNEAAFANLQVERPGQGGPILPDCLAYLHVRVEGRMPAGDHELIVGEVLEGRLQGESPPMVHVRKSGMHY